MPVLRQSLPFCQMAMTDCVGKGKWREVEDNCLKQIWKAMSFYFSLGNLELYVVSCLEELRGVQINAKLTSAGTLKWECQVFCVSVAGLVRRMTFPSIWKWFIAGLLTIVTFFLACFH